MRAVAQRGLSTDLAVGLFGVAHMITSDSQKCAPLGIRWRFGSVQDFGMCSRKDHAGCLAASRECAQITLPTTVLKTTGPVARRTGACARA